jgi:hypothetical protein
MIGDKISQRKIDLKGKFQNQVIPIFIYQSNFKLLVQFSALLQKYCRWPWTKDLGSILLC